MTKPPSDGSSAASHTRTAVNTSGRRAPMKIVLWGINYAPEPIGIAPFNHELGTYLAAAGHDVTAVTAFAYYPYWRKSPQDAGLWHRTEMIDGVRVERCWCFVPRIASSVKRMAHEFSFGLASFWRVLRLPRADVYVVVSPPLVLGLFAWLATLLKGSRYVFHVQDLQPDAAISLGMLRRGFLVRVLYLLEKLSYAKATRVSGISGGMVSAFLQKGVPRRKAVLLPNWLREGALHDSTATREGARRALGVTPDALLAVYSGNLGRKQGLDVIVAAAHHLNAESITGDSPVRFIIAGDGAAKAELAQRLAAQADANIQLLPLLDEPAYRDLLKAADVALITQSAGVGRVFFPSKLLTVLSAGLPVVAVADDDSELAHAVHEGGFGDVVAADDALGLAAALRDVVRNPAKLQEWRERTTWVRKFAPRPILAEFESTLRATSADGSGLYANQTTRVTAAQPPVAI